MHDMLPTCILRALALAGAVAALSFAAPPAYAAESARKPKGGRDVAGMGDEDVNQFAEYIRAYGAAPVDYIVGKFEDHDVVLIGEMHEIEEYLRFYADLLGPLYHKAGVRVLGMEVLKSKHNERLRELVTAAEFDREGVLDIFRDEFHGTWGFREYVDLVEAAWRLNSALPETAEPFVVVGLSADITYPAEGGFDVEKVDAHGAAVVAETALESGRKALVQIGYNHTFLEYRQVLVENGERKGEMPPRMGCRLYEKYGDRVFQVCLHHDHVDALAMRRGRQGWRGVLGGLVERAFKAAGGKPVGFDVAGSPFADLRDRRSYYFAWQPAAVFEDIAKGYVIIKPFGRLDRKMTWIDGFITDVNFARARAFALDRGLIKPDECRTPDELDRLFKRAFGGQ